MAVTAHVSAFGPVLFGGRLYEGIALLGELGFDVVEVSLRSPADVDRAHLRKALARSGLELSAIATGQACLFDSLCLASQDPVLRRAALDRLRSFVELAADLGADVIVGGILGRLGSDPDDMAVRRDAAVSAVRECARLAERVGVRLLVEPINRYETDFINTAAAGLRFIDDVGESSGRLLLDTFHMNIEEASFEAAILGAGDRLGYVHLVDSNRRAPGQGHIPIAAILNTLAESGYRGPIVSEILPVPDDETAARQTAAFWAAAAPSRASAPPGEVRRE